MQTVQYDFSTYSFTLYTRMTWKYGEAGSYMPVVGRVFIGLLFLAGLFKFMGVEATTAWIASIGLPMPSLIFWVSTIVEIAAAVALILGVHARTAAWVLFVYTGLTVALFHNNLADQLQMTMALKNLAIMGGLLYVARFGPGMWSLWTNPSCDCCDDGSCVCGMGEKKGV